MDPKNKKIFSNAGLTSTMEDYLEAIYRLSKENEVVRVKNIADCLHVKMPTVTSMLKKLKEKGMIGYEKYESVNLTRNGSDLGHEICVRHKALSTFLTDILLVENVQADEDACKMEHALSYTTLERIVDFMKFVESCPRAGNDWLTCFNEFKNSGKQNQGCMGEKEGHVFNHCPEINHQRQTQKTGGDKF